MIYKCSVCGEEFESDISDEEAMIETKSEFGEDVSIEDCDVVCDDCYRKVKPSANPDVFLDWFLSQ